MPGRSFSATSQYRYGFNGKENDKDISAGGQDYGMRIYDSRLGKFLSVDPIGGQFPWNSPYAFSENDPLNFIDLDGLERAIPPRPGNGRGGGRRGVSGLRSQAEHLAEEVGRSARANREVINRAQNIRHLRNMRTNPDYARAYNQTQGIIESGAKQSYLQRYFRNAFGSAETIYGGGNIRDNNKAGEKWDSYVHKTLLENPNYIGVARQVSLKVTGEINGQTVVAKIRIDNVGIRKDATGKVLFDLVEAKYSISEITINNVKQTLTPQQKMTEFILLNGTDVRFFVRGAGSASVLSQSSAASGTAFQKDQDITTHISQISVVVPSGSASTPTSNSPVAAKKTEGSSKKE